MMSKKTILFALLVLAVAAPALATETLEVKATVNGPWTTFDYPWSFPSSGFSNQERAALGARDGSIWWGVNDGAVRYDEKTWTKYTAADGLMEGAVLSIAQGVDGVLWFSGSHQGKAAVTRYDGQTWTIYSEADGLVGEWAGHASVDTRGHLWVQAQQVGRAPPSLLARRSAGGLGVMRFDGTEWKNFRVEDGLVNNRVYNLVTHPDGSVWIGTFYGVSRFDGETWTTHTPWQGGMRDGKIYGMWVAQDGKVWCTHGQGIQGTGQGISVFDGTSWKVYTRADGLLVPHVLPVHQTPDGAIWFGTPPEEGASGLVRYVDDAWLHITHKDGLPEGRILGITHAGDGSLWLTVPGIGPVRYAPEAGRLGPVSGAVARPDGSPLAGVGLHALDAAGEIRAGATTDPQGRFRLEAFPGVHRLFVVNGQGADTLEVKLEAGKAVSGLRFTPEAVEPGTRRVAGRGKGHWRVYGVADGMGSENVRAITQDRQGNLWFGTTQGVSRYDGRTFVTFTEEDGLGGNSTFWSILGDREGNIWVPTNDTVGKF